jgi:hypothetical protein
MVTDLKAYETEGAQLAAEKNTPCLLYEETLAQNG